MKRSILSALVLSGLIANAQDYKGRVGINTETPRATLEVKAVTPDGRAQGILFPHISNEEKDKWKTDIDKGLVAGTVIWNTNKNCLDYFDGTLWQCMDGSQKSAPADKPITLPQGLNISNGQHWIVSIYDTQYLPHTVPTVAASWTKGEANGPDTLIDIKGKIPAAGITVQIPIKATGNATLPAYTAYAITPAEAWEDRTARLLELSWAEQTLTASNTSLTTTIKVKDATTDQYLTQLDIEKGLGSEYNGLLLGQFKMPSGYTETTPNAYTGTYDVRVISGIPDRNFGKKTQLTGSTTAELLHQFIYLPIKAEDGKIWLNNNLGAEYADYNNKRGFFDPAQQATSKDDYKAFGSLFQWQRKADGHELITWVYENNNYNSSKISDAEQGRVDADWVAPQNNTNFYYSDGYPNSWVTSTYANSNHALWQTNGSNNPCPVGFHVPTKTEWELIRSQTEIAMKPLWNQKINSIKLSLTGYRTSQTGVLQLQHLSAFYMNSTRIPHYSGNVNTFDITSDKALGNDRSPRIGGPVRCIKD